MKASDVKRENGKLVYRGQKFDGFNKPKNAPAGAKEKKIVLAKKGDDVKLVRFGLRGMEDYTQHGSEKRRKNYLSRSAGIRDKSGKLTKDDKFSANYWARKVLW
jgi:TFIIF-interacting CTD phosphatase-like protein